jgi:hypothetical protein
VANKSYKIAFNGMLGQAVNCWLLLHNRMAWKWLHMAVSARRAEKAAEDNSSSAGSGFESLGAHHKKLEFMGVTEGRLYEETAFHLV